MPDEKVERKKHGDTIYETRTTEKGSSTAPTTGGLRVGQGGTEDEMEAKYGAGTQDPSVQKEKMDKLGRAWGVWRKNNPSGGAKGTVQKKALQ